MLDVDFARSRFPGLSEDWALFDNAGGSLPLGAVIDRVVDYMSRRQVQLGATYRHSAEAAEQVAAGRAAAARLVNADPDEIVLGPSSTANVATLARALRPGFAPGDEIVVSNLDHESNIGPWRGLAAGGLRIREWTFDPGTLELTLAGLEPLLGPRTRLVCFTQCSNITGALQDTVAIVRRVHAAGALACVDGVAFAPHRRVDVKAIGADFYFLSLYKVYGPHVGVLYGRRDLLREAAGVNHFFIGEDRVPGKFEPGGVVHELVAGLPAIVEYLEALGRRVPPPASQPDPLDAAFDAITAHEVALVTPLLDFLANRRGVRVLGPGLAEPRLRVPTVSFVVSGQDAAQVPPRLDAQHIAIRYGDFYARRAIEALGLLPTNGVLRASLIHYSTAAEVERLITALDRAL